MSERRTAVLIDPKMSGLPAFLTDDGGVNSGLMIPQVTQAALVAENRSLAFPSSVDSVPTCAGQEDHVSMAPISARKAATIARNAAGIVAVELIAAAQGVDYHAPLKTSAKLQAVHAKVREISPRLESDRYWADEMAALQAAVLEGQPWPGVQPLTPIFRPGLPGSGPRSLAHWSWYRCGWRSSFEIRCWRAARLQSPSSWRLHRPRRPAPWS